MTRAYNFSAGPAMLPESVLQQAAREMMDWHGSGMSVMEMSHRGEAFAHILKSAEQDVRALLSVPDHYHILFLQSGATALNAIIPLNLLGKKPAATIHVLHTGTWSGKALLEAQKYAPVQIVASSESSGFDHIPPREQWKISKNAAYLHVCTNETIHGVEFQKVPEVGDVTLVADMSSHIFSRPVDVSRYGVIYAGAQKNLGLAGLTLVIVREDLIGHALPFCPSVYDWRNIAREHSLFNTPPTYAIYLCALMLEWIREQGGVTELEKHNIAKAACLYDFLDSTDFYLNRVHRECRSRMNIPFFLQNASLEATFLEEAQVQGLLQLRGHRLTGGMRASLYNAMPMAGVQKLVEFMRDFARRYA